MSIVSPPWSSSSLLLLVQSLIVRSCDTVAIHELSAVISREATFDSCPAKLLTSEKSLPDHIWL